MEKKSPHTNTNAPNILKKSFNFMELTQFIMRARQLQIQLQIIFILQIN